MDTPQPDASPTRPPRTIFRTLLVFRCSTELSERLAELAGRQGKTVSAAIRDILHKGLTRA